MVLTGSNHRRTRNEGFARERLAFNTPRKFGRTLRADAQPLACIAFFVIASLLMFASHAASAIAQEPRFPGSPVVFAVSDGSGSVFVGNYGLPGITAINCESLDVRIIAGRWSEIVDAAILPQRDRLIAGITTPPSLLSISAGPEQSTAEPPAVALPAIPSRVAVSLNGQFAGISLTWDHSICIVPLSVEGDPQSEGMKCVALNFAPKELLALPDQKFLVADAFGGRLAVIDAQSCAVIATHELPCHHIGGMARDDSGLQILITHQHLSRVAESSHDDIHWGTLMQNSVAAVPQAALLNVDESINSSIRIRQLGDVGNGAGDPAGIVAWGPGHFAVAVAGTSQVAVWKHAASAPLFIDVGRMPTRLVHIEPSKLLCVSALDHTASLIHCSDDLCVLKVFGTPRELKTAEDRGEAAFFSAALSHDGWMSCSSCHVDGHSPDLLADTMGDGRFGNPKRIPSLLNSSHTGPWAWDGSKTSLEVQIQQTLATTMHRDDRTRTSDSGDEDVARDIVAWLRTLSTPPVSDIIKEAMAPGEAAFHERGCIKCHDPERNYTSPLTFDVGVRDELGTSVFNPPSLNGLRHRQRYFHDARFRSLDELLQHHPDAHDGVAEKETENLKAFLMSL